MQFRKAKRSDLKKIEAIIPYVVKSGEGKGLNWTSVYPTINHFERDFEKGELYVMASNPECNEDIVYGAVVLNSDEDINYKKAAWSNSQKALVPHRLMVNPEFQRMGNGKRLMTFIEEEGKKRNLKSIRLDTNITNVRAQGLYIKSGFKKVGVINLEGKIGEFICLEKIL
ncbi:MAG: GNAT family N-acetyltransferase [Clostridium sp.]|uniref:GNAT family N-acetyltransferase n=1 Tax=Clostridium sp. TaxID=1506 RepID=UPI003F3C2C25